MNGPFRVRTFFDFELARKQEKIEGNERLVFFIIRLICDYFPNGKPLNLPDFGRIQEFGCYVNL